MAIGDAGAAHGLTIYASTQDRRLGYQNDNQRADDIAAVMDRATTLESNAKTPNQVTTAANKPGTVADGATQAVTGTVTVPKVTYARNIRINWRALVTAVPTGNTYVDIFLVRTDSSGSTQVVGGRTYGAGSASGVFDDQLAANATVSYQIVANPSNGSAAITGDTRFTQLQVTSRAINS